MKLTSIISRQWEALLQFIYPPVCMSCQQIISEQSPVPNVCPVCLNGCQTVSRAFVQTKIIDRLQPCFLDNLIICVEFGQTMQAIIHHIKYQQMNRLAIYSAAWAIQFLPSDFIRQSIDLVVPVPLYPVREKERGFNQSYYVAKGFFSEDHTVITTDLLRRAKATQSQTTLSRTERIQNVSDAFRLNSAITIQGESVVLVDDVVTTGATLNECAKILKKAGAAEVIALTLATPVDDHLMPAV